MHEVEDGGTERGFDDAVGIWDLWAKGLCGIGGYGLSRI